MKYDHMCHVYKKKALLLCGDQIWIIVRKVDEAMETFNVYKVPLAVIVALESILWNLYRHHKLLVLQALRSLHHLYSPFRLFVYADTDLASRLILMWQPGSSHVLQNPCFEMLNCICDCWIAASEWSESVALY